MSNVEGKSNFICVGVNDCNDIVINIAIKNLISTIEIDPKRARIFNEQLSDLLDLDIFQEKN